ncbi:hypothetical protein ACIQBJ_25135 [Kitasatospora sp. NPDC088391]|uniref:hypothetical protein n=1 Tax=Kitasatospora sp. NPDC088391 TaxID=3364074 RepID=UPI00380252CC
MESVAADGAAAAPGLRIAVDFYSAKAEQLRSQQADLEAKLAAVAAELSKACDTRDQLTEVLVELTRDVTGTPAAPEADQVLGEHDAAVSSAQAVPAPPTPEDGRAPGRAKSGEVMQAILQILVTSGRPMRVRDITGALGRPTNGPEGRAPMETTRSMCKRLVKNGKAVEGPAGVFAIAQTESHARGAA